MDTDDVHQVAKMAWKPPEATRQKASRGAAPRTDRSQASTCAKDQPTPEACP
jgi:hypothetical protein